MLDEYDELKACQREVELGKKHNVNTKIYDKNCYSSKQRKYIRIALEAGLNPKSILDKDYMEDDTLKALKHLFKKTGHEEDLKLYMACPEIIVDLLEDDFKLIVDFMKD